MSSTFATDAAIPMIAEMKALTNAGLYNTDVSKAGHVELGKLMAIRRGDRFIK